MYETYIDDNKKIIETGNILFANLKLRAKITLYTFLIRKEVLDIMIKMVKALRKH